MRQPSRGFMMADAVVGLVLLGVLGTLLVAMMGRTQRADQRLEQRQDLLLTAQKTMSQLQAGKRVEIPGVTVSKLAGDGPGRGMAWVEVKVKDEAGEVSLVGGVSEKAIVVPGKVAP